MKDFFKPRTIFALLFYCTFLYLVARGRPVPEALGNIVISLLSFYFGQRSKKVDNGSNTNSNKPTT